MAHILRKIRNIEDYLIPEIGKRLEPLGFNLTEWTINIDKSEGEGHGYVIKDNTYEELSGIEIINKQNSSDILTIWIDYAWVKGMDLPILYLETIYPKELLLKYNLKYMENPNNIIFNSLNKEQIKELNKQYYYANNRHMSLFKKYN